MRNFKKFLALVLAMLMVSACAVSAAIVDMDDVKESYVEAVTVMENLKILVGDEKGNFKPQGTLTRAAAAKIVALVDLGAEGQNIDWTAATTDFTDVPANHWASAYINYASQNGIVDGRGNGIFDPEANVTVAEALTYAVKLAGGRSECMTADKDHPTSFWATNWVNWAKENDLAIDVPTINLNAPCTREVFAQIAYNVLNAFVYDADGKEAEGNKIVKDFAKGFGLDTKVAVIEKIVDDTVTLSGDIKVNLDALNAAIKAAGIEGDAASLKGSEITLTYSNKTNLIYGVEVTTTVETYTYVDAAIAYAKKSDGKTTDYAKLVIDGVTYDVHKTAQDGDKDAGSIGTAIGKSNYIAVELNGDLIDAADAKDIPTYYTAVAYDDDADGDFDRIAIDSYKIAVSVAAEDAIKINDVETAVDEITNLDGSKWSNNIAGKEKAYAYFGETIEDKSRPFLYNVKPSDDDKTYEITVLEIAEIETDVVAGYGSDYIKVGSETYKFVADAVKPDAWMLKQTVSIYTIGGQFVKVLDTAVVAENSNVLVEKVAIKDDKAVITGYAIPSGAAVTVTVEGVSVNDKLYSASAKQMKVGDKETAVAVATAFEDIAKTDSTPEIKNSPKANKGFVLADGAIYSIKKTVAGSYIMDQETASVAGLVDFVKGLDKDGKYTVETIKSTDELDTIAIDGSYVKLGKDKDNLISKFYNAGAVIFTKGTKADAAYYDSAFVTKTDKLAANTVTGTVSLVKNADGKVFFVYVDGIKDVYDESVIKTIEEGYSIVYVPKKADVKEETTWEGYTYENVVDLMTGTKVTIESVSKMYEGCFYLVKNGVNNGIINFNNGVEAHWLKKDMAVEVTYSGLIQSIKATRVEKVVPLTGDDKDPKYIFATGDDAKKEYGVGSIKVYGSDVVKSDNSVDLKELKNTALAYDENQKPVTYIGAYVFADANQLIIIEAPAAE